MEITRQADYAVRAVLHVARLAEGKREPTSSIAKAQDIPLPFLAKIISQLAVAGIVDAMRGASGGVRLARPASEISLLDVVQVIDGPIALNRCVAGGEGCGREPICPLHDVWSDVQKELIHRLESTRFDTLAARADRMESESVSAEETAA